MGQLPAQLLHRVRARAPRGHGRHLHDQRAFSSGEQAASLAALARQFPSVSIFDIDDLLDQVRSVFDKAVLAVQSVFFFTLFAGLTVLMAAVQASRDERRYESAMLRTLGASRGTVLQGVLAEFATLGLLSACSRRWALRLRLLRRHARAGDDVRFDPWVWLVGMSAARCSLPSAAGLPRARSSISRRLHDACGAG